MNCIPIGAVIATVNRSQVLHTTLDSLFGQSSFPEQVIVVDASDNDDTRILIEKHYPSIQWIRANMKGAAAQRNQGAVLVRSQFVFFMDDDIVFNENCLQRLWEGIANSTDIGGVNAMITNQQYYPPGRITQFMYKLMHGQNLSSYAGMCIGPAWNLLPADNDQLPTMQRVEWLNTTCTIYRKKALPEPAFASHFSGYSLMEDLSLSLEVGKQWKLYNARTARIYHDSQPGNHKNNRVVLSKMELVNRYYVMVNILARKGPINYIKLIVFELFGIASSLSAANGWKQLPATVYGKLSALKEIVFKWKR